MSAWPGRRRGYKRPRRRDFPNEHTWLVAVMAWADWSFASGFDRAEAWEEILLRESFRRTDPTLARLSELVAAGNLTDDEAAELERLTSDYRARRRRGTDLHRTTDIEGDRP